MMNNEEIERKMNFIVEQQAQFASDIQRLENSQARTEKAMAQTDQVVAKTAEAVAEVADVVTRLANVTHAGFTDVNAKLNALIDAQIRSEERLARTDAQIVLTQEQLARTDAQIVLTQEQLAQTDAQIALTDKQLSRTDESLRSLTALVDRHLRKRRN